MRVRGTEREREIVNIILPTCKYLVNSPFRFAYNHIKDNQTKVREIEIERGREREKRERERKKRQREREIISSFRNTAEA